MKNSLVSNSTVSYVNEIIETGINERASDIHILKLTGKFCQET